MLSQTSKLILMFLGLLAAILIVAQLFLGQFEIIGHLATAVALVYILFSVWVMTSVPTSPSTETTPTRLKD